jgi:hypothetical protein
MATGQVTLPAREELMPRSSIDLNRLTAVLPPGATGTVQYVD